jgi:hypothetical protein
MISERCKNLGKHRREGVHTSVSICYRRGMVRRGCCGGGGVNGQDEDTQGDMLYTESNESNESNIPNMQTSIIEVGARV